MSLFLGAHHLQNSYSGCHKCVYKDVWGGKNTKLETTRLSSGEWLNVFQCWHEDMEHMECDQ